MTACTLTIAAPRDQVWDALIDVRTYPHWLVGARRIRSIDDAWPEPGSAFHHVVGFGPIKIADKTISIAVDPKRRLELEVRARPAVQATVVFELKDTPDGGTEVEMEEHPIGVHRVLAPVLAPLTQARNRASLDQLETRVRERAERTAP